jgi:phosphopantothenoylcysteine decarboxylase/phosphopantothenate--cysteine ligase
MELRRRKVLLGITGGIAAYKTPELARDLIRKGFQVGAVLTPSALSFVSPLVLKTLCNGPVLTDMWEVEEGGRISHIECADWADLYCIAPLTANTLGKLAGGVADEPVSLVYLATKAQVVVFPSMNVNMWHHRRVQENVKRLREDGVVVIDPEEGDLACGWVGEGRLPEREKIVEVIEDLLTPKSLRGYTFVVTAGPTREYLDPVRFISNPSTGTMGFQIGGKLAKRGAQVFLVTGPVSLSTPLGVKRVDVISAEEMLNRVREIFFRESPTGIIATSAVVDFKPLSFSSEKWKTEEIPSHLSVERNPHILERIVEEFDPPLKIGFALETQDLDRYAMEKLTKRKLDLLVGNLKGEGKSPFGEGEKEVFFYYPSGEKKVFSSLTKEEIAEKVVEEVERIVTKKGIPPVLPKGGPVPAG